MLPILISGPIAEPVTLAQAKSALRLDTSFTDDDALITSFIIAARQYCESYTARIFFNQTFLLSLDHFPFNWDVTSVSPAKRGDYLLGTYWMRRNAILLPNPRCVSVQIQYYDITDTLQTLASNAYDVDVNQEPAVVSMKYGTYWPTTTIKPGAVQVQWTSGTYGDGAILNTIPQTAVTAILMLVSGWYGQRESISPMVMSEVPFAVKSLLDTIRFHKF